MPPPACRENLRRLTPDAQKPQFFEPLRLTFRRDHSDATSQPAQNPQKSANLTLDPIHPKIARARAAAPPARIPNPKLSAPPRPQTTLERAQDGSNRISRPYFIRPRPAPIIASQLVPSVPKFQFETGNIIIEQFQRLI
jgi:hypothetical protein